MIKVSEYDQINQVVNDFIDLLLETLAKNIQGIYLFGSLTYGDFNLESSDIDLMVVNKELLNDSEILIVKEIHETIANRYPLWKERLECSYTPLKMLSSISPPGARPYYGEGKFYEKAEYGNEWIINLYILEHYGINLYGPKFSEIINPIDIKLIQEVCKKDLIKEWVPKLNDAEWLENPHYQSYLVLNLCRILNTFVNAKVLSKKKSAQWVIEKYPRWNDLINSALVWKYGDQMKRKDETLEFLKFVISIVN